VIEPFGSLEVCYIFNESSTLVDKIIIIIIMQIHYHDYTINSSCNMNERISRQPVPYEPLYRPSPTDEIFTEISKDFNICWNFPNCIERIDAKNVRIHCPPNSASQYFNYTQCHSSVLKAVADANIKFVTVDVGAYGKQNDGGVFRNSAVYQSLETRSLQVPKDTVLLHSEIRLPRIFVGDEAYTLTTSIIKPYSRRALDRNKAIFNYRLSRARLVVESAVGICASKCRMLDKAIETKVDTGV
jgi:hypothetical protein